MFVNGAVKYDDIGHLRDHLPDAITLNQMDDHALLALQGPKAAAVLARLVPGVEALVFMTGWRFEWNGIGLWISRSGYTGEAGFRSEEHTSELQSLMRISYAVFCLKKKKKKSHTRISTR